MSIVDSYLNIKYDGKERSFKIGRNEEEAFKKGLAGIWQGEYSVRVILIDGGCGFRFVKPKLADKAKKDPPQTRLVESYLPPPELWTEEKKKVGKLSSQKKLFPQPYFISSRPLFRGVGRKTQQTVLF